jgi:hypothetical protein
MIVTFLRHLSMLSTRFRLPLLTRIAVTMGELGYGRGLGSATSLLRAVLMILAH